MTIPHHSLVISLKQIKSSKLENIESVIFEEPELTIMSCISMKKQVCCHPSNIPMYRMGTQIATSRSGL